MFTWDNYVSTYLYIDPMQWTMWSGSMVPIHFTLLAYGPEQIYLPHYIIGHTSPKKNCNFYLSCYCHICATNMPVKCHIYATCANYFMCIHHTTVSVYMLHMNSMQSTVWLQALISIHSHYWHMPLKIYASYIVNVKGFMIDVPLVQWVINNSCSIN